MKKTQTNSILNYLKNHKSGITSMDAFKLFGATRLSAIIFSLRHQGYNISSTVKPVKNRYGGRSYVSCYVLEG